MSNASKANVVTASYLNFRSVTFWSGLGLISNGIVLLAQCVFANDCPPDGMSAAFLSILQGGGLVGLKRAISATDDPPAKK